MTPAAFPFHGSDGDRYESDPGMDLIDYFAAKAMQSLVLKIPVTGLSDNGRKEIVNEAYGIANAMMEVRDTEAHPLDSLRAQIQADDDLAWTWHANVAVCFMDEGGSHKMAQHAAARFMQTLFGVDVTKFVEWQKFEKIWEQLGAKEATP